MTAEQPATRCRTCETSRRQTQHSQLCWAMGQLSVGVIHTAARLAGTCKESSRTSKSRPQLMLPSTAFSNFAKQYYCFAELLKAAPAALDADWGIPVLHATLMVHWKIKIRSKLDAAPERVQSCEPKESARNCFPLERFFQAETATAVFGIYPIVQLPTRRVVGTWNMDILQGPQMQSQPVKTAQAVKSFAPTLLVHICSG